ncbi:ATP-binding protein [Latilactobacillus curvatus]|uniref:ATP-binding protein n=1 Tax=Latilactobacillus curvatus TaxID=28038 RepID=UPI000FECCE87|nr:ATP-binding protein [Latilactobacillus curvatus]QAR34610.1 hypothetical protein EQK21_00425 [Latilactobacillus curvatus]
MDMKQFWDAFNQGNFYRFDDLCPTCGHFLVAFKGRDGKPLSNGACPSCGYLREQGHLDKAKQTDEFYRQARKNDAINFLTNVSVFTAFSVFNHRFDNFIVKTDKQRQLYDQAISVSDRLVNNNLLHSVFTGGTGTGKTHLAISVLQDVLEKTGYRKKAAFVDFQELLMLKKNAIGSREDSRMLDGKIAKIRQADLVVVDDLGAESNGETTQYNLDLASGIFKAREDKPIIITTNLEGKNLRTIYGERNLSRILAHSNRNNLIFNQLSDYRVTN